MAENSAELTNYLKPSAPLRDKIVMKFSLSLWCCNSLTYTYSLVRFITHKSISYKELCQYFFSYYFMIIYHYPLLFNKYDVISGVTFHIIFFITPNKYEFQLPQTVFKNPLGRL